MGIKICGLFREVDIEYANIAKPDYVGFVYAKSKRQVTKEKSKLLRALLDKKIKVVGVFVNEDIEFIKELVEEDIIDIIQLHGDEDESYIRSLRDIYLLKKVPIIKAIRVQKTEDITAATNMKTEYILLDTYSKDAYGGTGDSFDWSVIKSLEKPFFLAGGINLSNILEAKKYNPFCIDVSSGVETDGVKDKDKMIEIVKKYRAQ